MRCLYCIIGASIITSGEFGSPNDYSLIENVTCTSVSSTALSSCDIVYAGDCIPNCPESNIGIRCFGK